ncbi:MAG: LemA family protein [Clostridia bacterium]|nr:LemA family protein [Clostridia bacterium]
MFMWIALIVIALIILWVIFAYNGLVRKRMKVQNSWGQIDVQLQRRFDLIPNLVNCVKGYMEHEKDTLAKVTELRTSWANASSISEKVELDNQLSGALKTIMAVSEAYPDLKANQNFSELQEELRNTENKISYSRQFYNDSVTMYNTALLVFPTNLIASMFNFTAEKLFVAESEEARKNVKVDFGNN